MTDLEKRLQKVGVALTLHQYGTEDELQERWDSFIAEIEHFLNTLSHELTPENRTHLIMALCKGA